MAIKLGGPKGGARIAKLYDEPRAAGKPAGLGRQSAGAPVCAEAAIAARA